MNSFRRALWQGSLFIAMAAAVHAQRAATTSASEAAGKKDAPAAVQESGQQAKPTVTLREPSKEEIKVLLEGMAPLVNDSAEGLTVVERPDGSLFLDHQGRFQNVSVAKTNADGTVSIECASSLEQIRQFLSQKKVALGATPPPASAGARASKPVLTPPAQANPGKSEEK